MSWYYNAKPTIKTDEGIKAKSKRGAFVKNWWATHWIEAMEQLMDRGRLSRGRRYARKGQVLSLTEETGKVTAKVQGSRTRPYSVAIEVKPLTAGQWHKVIDALATRPIFLAQLLGGEMPQDIEEAFSEVNLSLFPSSAQEITQECNCPDWASVCKHLAAAHYILAERFDEDPFLLFRLRGQSQDELLAALRERQGNGLLREGGPEYDVPEYEMPSPLPAVPAEFWEIGKNGVHFPVRIGPPSAPYPALTRLGAPAFLEDIEQQLGPVYDAISAAAIASVFTDDRDDASEDDASEEEDEAR
jgi:uncharacterized Zn finger protein